MTEKYYCLTPQEVWGTAFMIYLIIFAGQLTFTTVAGISGRDKEMQYSDTRKDR